MHHAQKGVIGLFVQKTKGLTLSNVEVDVVSLLNIKVIAIVVRLCRL